ncbi:uncharacterized protein F4807DRAFT_1961 [Annulohypoxylon truncatum]|uniref:uncharacterized protein n=1 Tax=Annulohypoxylon truncatum TaxID=327061 RepID=UPI002007C72C|nr:uncharacterized protein F4807DRAFT_1961 [Annulohypoxylon truncatum]KAI1214569.1 hypothetical protein F4807DRAFT_1961 [Annulohypoxylon truncatum]
MSTSRIFTSGLRTVTRRAAQAPTSRQSAMRTAARRGYASSGHGGSAGAEKSSDLPWLIASVGITIPGLAWMLSGPSTKPASHGSSHGDTPAAASEPSPDPAAEDSSDSDSDSSGSDTHSSSSSSSSDSGSGSSEPPESQPNPKGTSSQTGQQVPPPPADNTDAGTDPEGKRKAQEGYKQIIEEKNTRAATSSSDMPSKKAAAEHPREDPQKGEGEGVQKGGPK